jgi:hypothetical protein
MEEVRAGCQTTGVEEQDRGAGEMAEASRLTADTA